MMKVLEVRNLFLGLSAIAILGGCATSDPTPPTPLADIPDSGISVNEVWDYSLGGAGEDLRLALRPAVDSKHVYVADYGGSIVALDRQSGDEVWEFDTYDFSFWGESTFLAFSGGPATGDGLVVAGTNNGIVLALAADTGEEKWRKDVQGEILAAPAVGDGLVILRISDGRLLALDTGSGEEAWVTGRETPSLTLRGLSTPVITSGQVITGFDNGRVVSVSSRDGSSLWETQIGVPGGTTVISELVDVDAEVAVFRDDVYATSYNGALTNLVLQSGDELWKEEFSSTHSPAVDYSNVYATDQDGNVFAFDRLSSREIWKQPGLLYRAVTGPVTFEQMIVVGDFEGYLHFLDRDTGEIKARIAHDGEPIRMRPVADGDMLFVQSDDGDIAAYRIVRNR